MNYEVNDTSDYHLYDLDTLGWELTVCNALDPQHSPCRRVLKRNDSYGHLLYDHLDRFIPMRSLQKIIEIGGGYGYLTRDFLNRSNLMQTKMNIRSALPTLKRCPGLFNPGLSAVLSQIFLNLILRINSGILCWQGQVARMDMKSSATL
jgi:hypothetical protein